MKTKTITAIVFAVCCMVGMPLHADERPRLAVLTDIGGDPDDLQSLVRLLVYSNEFEIEALIASASGTPGELKQAVTRTDLISKAINAYDQVRPNLVKHAENWPDAKDLRAVVHSGNRLRGVQHIGVGHDTAGSRWLVERIDSGSADRPLNISIWGGQTDLAQALDHVRRNRSDAEWKRFVKKFRVYDIADQDNIASWMRERFPGMHYILSTAPPQADKRQATFRGMYLTGDESLTSRSWIQTHIRETGPLGALYPIKTWTAPNPHQCMKEGDTPSWFFFLPAGGNNPSDPTRPGWGGRFQAQHDSWFRDLPIADDVDPRATVARWRQAFQQDFAKRMQWCVARGK